MSDGDNYAKDGPAAIAWSGSVDALVVQLPHQCSEWVIGGAEQVRALMADLQALLPEFDHPDRYRHGHHCGRCGKTWYRPDPVCPKYCQSGQNVCAQCFYPAQDERQAACQAAQHPERTCEMPWCQTCFWCRLGCRCEPFGRSFGSPSLAPAVPPAVK